MQVLNKFEKEQLVISLHKDGKTMREIASTVHMSFGDISNLIRKVDGRANDVNLRNKSKATQALYLFERGKKPIDIAIELDIPYDEVVELQQEYWVLKELYDLAFVYMEIRNDLPSFIELFKLLKQNKMLSEKHILKFLNYASDDLPTLEHRCQQLSSSILELQFRKKKLGDEVFKLSSYLSQLGKLQKWYQTDIGLKKEIISNLNQQLNQKSQALEMAQLRDS